MNRTTGIIAATALTAAALVGIAPAASAHEGHRQMAKAMTVTVFEQMSTTEQSDLCDAWDLMPGYFIRETSKVMTGLGMSAADRRWGIHAGMDENCSGLY